MTKRQAAEGLVDFLAAYCRINMSIDDAERTLDFITTEDGETGLGLFPPMDKKGRHQWSQLTGLENLLTD